MLIARIDAATSLVVNVEVATPEWATANADPDGPFLFVEYDDTNPARIGHAWEPIGGFHDPTASTFVLTATELVDLGVTEAAVDKLTADKVAAVELSADAAPTKGTR
jgi:hypothetical protein